ncbi:glycosyl transferase [Methylobacterium sp. Leaf456]|uniref:glycosyltransferase family 2 protein n=1 Tax=Methylobacterium sp. Leaf456 TaxID=1736382 RepID=UPI0006F8E036|nr:glycosyltransferase [Methylobacterium sp. Leaf456]KQT46470.1 glycosyl transferase [Methylobacterium sp. Leaf456]
MRRREAFHLHALRDLRRGPDGAWIATGPDPVLGLGPDAAVAGLSGARVRVRCRHEGAVPVLAVEAEGLAAPQRYRLTPLPGEPGIDDLIRLPPATRALRIEPGATFFRLDAVSVEPLSRIAAARYRVRKILERLPPQERTPLRLMRRALGLLRTVPPGEILRRLTRAGATARPPASYADWIAAVEAPALPSSERMQELVSALPARPTLSVLMAAGADEAERVAATLASLRAQAYPDWELCLATNSPFPTDEPRLRPCRPGAPGEAASLQAALAAARGSHLMVVEPGAQLPPHALLAFARRLVADPGLDLVYADEDRLTPDGSRAEPHFKPDWSPETLEAGFYIGRPALYRTERVQALGGFRAACAGALDYDLALRLTADGAGVDHIAQVLAHRPTDTPLDDAAALRALEARGPAHRLAPGTFALRRALATRPLVSIVIPTAGRDSMVGGRRINLLANCLDSLRERTAYERIEIVVVEHGVLPEPARGAMERHGARGVPYPDPAFHFAAKMNRGARAATGEILIFLNDDIAVITPDWIEAMLSLLAIPGVGAVGPKLLFEDGTLQHVGVVFGEGFPDHVCRGRPGDEAGYHGSSLANRNYLAVTGACVMVRRADFEAVGGFDETYPVNYNDIDLCLRLHERGLRTVYCADAALHHYESRNRVPVVDPHEQARFRRRWGARIARDPYYPDAFGIRPPAFGLDAERFPQAACRMVEAWR